MESLLLSLYLFCNVASYAWGGDVNVNFTSDTIAHHHTNNRFKWRLQRQIPEPQEPDNLEFFGNYHRHNEIEEYIKQLVKHHHSVAKVFSIGKSAEGRELTVIKIGPNTKPAIWIDGGIHAREWLSPPTVIYTAYKLMKEFSSNLSSSHANNTIHDFCWSILPVVNPAGYEYSHTTDRLWRKNRAAKNNTACLGVDLNRNWNYHWNEAGSSQNACDDVYSGEIAFSEPETRNIADFILKKTESQKFSAFLTFHSFGQAWLYPWGWTDKPVDGYEDLKRAALEAVEAVYQLHGRHYSVGSSGALFGIAAGGSDDWARGVAGIKYSYTVELPDTGRYGFLMPKKNILPVGEEIWEGIQAFAKVIANDTNSQILTGA